MVLQGFRKMISFPVDNLRIDCQAWCWVYLGCSRNSVDQGLYWQTLSVKDQKVNIFCFVGHVVSVALAVHATIDNP